MLGARPVASGEAPANGLADAFARLAALVPTAGPTNGCLETSLIGEAAALAGTVLRALGAAPAETVHAGFAIAWVRPAAADVTRRTLVLLSDHELNASTFAARVAASTGARLPASLLTAWRHLTGPLHGAAALVRQSLAEGRQLPDFGHPLYVGMDPGAADILDAVPSTDDLDELGCAVLAETGRSPTSISPPPRW